MPLQITGRHLAVTDEQKDYIERKVDRLRRLCPSIDEMHFTLGKERVGYEASATFRAGRLNIKAAVTDPQALAAIDTLIDKLESQITRSKRKVISRKHDVDRLLTTEETELIEDDEEKEVEELVEYEDRAAEA